MKRLGILLMAGGSLLAMTAHAQAFEAVGLLVLNAAFAVPGGAGLLGALFPAGAGLGTIGAATVSALATAGSLANSLLSRPKVQTSSIKNTVKGGEGPGRQAFGLLELEGKLLYGNTAGDKISRLVAHAFGEMDSVEAYFYDGREIIVEADGYVSSPPWARPLTDPSPSWMQVRSKVGDGTETAWDTLLTDFAAWTADHRVRGIAQTLMRITSPGTASPVFGRLLQGGVKSVRIRGRMLKPYDPRTATNTWTMNGVIHVLHYLRRLNGVSDSDLDFDGIGDTADDADEAVDTLTGTAPRCQLSGGWEGPITTDIVADMMESAGVELVQTDEGGWTLRFLEDWPEPEITLTQRHIIDNYPQAGPESGLRPNICRLTYFSPERRYEQAEIDLTDAPWARVQAEIDAYGDHEFPCDLTFACDASQAQRIARRLFLMARADTGILKTTWAGMAAWGKKTMLVEIPDVGEDGASVFVRVRKGAVRPNDADGTCEIPYVIIPPELETPWDAATMEVAPPPVLVPPQAESDLDTPDQPSAACLVEYPNGDREIRVAYVEPAGGDMTEANYRIYDDMGLASAPISMTEVSGALDFAWAPVARVNILTNPGFDSSTGWTLPTGWTIGGGKATKSTPGTANSVNQPVTLSNGVTYTMGGTISGMSAGELRPRFTGGATLDATTAGTADGIFKATMTATANHTTAAFRADTSFNGSVDNVYLYRHDADGLSGAKLDFRVRLFSDDGDSSFFSDALVVDPLTIDNTAPDAPTVAIETYIFNPGPSEESRMRLTITVAELNVVRAVVELTDDAGSNWAAFDTYDTMRPGDNVFDTTELNASGKGFRVRLYTSDLTAGTSTGQAIVA